MSTAPPNDDPSPAPVVLEQSRLSSRPTFLLAATVGLIFLGEALIMLILKRLPEMPHVQIALLDAAVLSCLVFPGLYLLVFKPLRRHILRRQEAEKEKDGLIIDLRQALAEVKIMRGIVPICAACKKVPDDHGVWHEIEAYVAARTDAKFSHGICPDCARELYPDYSEESHDTPPADA